MSTTAAKTARGLVTRLYALDAPVLPATRGDFLFRGGTATVRCPFPSYLIEHPRCTVLVDTGFRPEAAVDPRGAYGELGPRLLPDGFPRELAVDRQLAQLGVELRDVDVVVMTHLHLDHTGGMALFDRARFVGGPGEMRFAWWPDPAQRGFYHSDDFAFLRDEPSRWVEIDSRDHDLLGDGSVRLLHLPGHTPGQLAVLVRTAEGTFLLASDVVHLRAGLDDGLPFPGDWRADQTARSIDRLKLLAWAEEAEIWVGHDPDDWTRYRHAPHSYG